MRDVCYMGVYVKKNSSMEDCEGQDRTAKRSSTLEAALSVLIPQLSTRVFSFLFFFLLHFG